MAKVSVDEKNTVRFTNSLNGRVSSPLPIIYRPVTCPECGTGKHKRTFQLIMQNFFFKLIFSVPFEHFEAESLKLGTVLQE